MLSMPGDPCATKELVKRAIAAEADGFDSAWLPQVGTVDALMALALAGRDTSRIELGTAVVPTYPRHPVVLAEQALTVQDATNNRGGFETRREAEAGFAVYRDEVRRRGRVDGTPTNPQRISRLFVRSAERAGLPAIRLHDYAPQLRLGGARRQRASEGGQRALGAREPRDHARHVLPRVACAAGGCASEGGCADPWASHPARQSVWWGLMPKPHPKGKRRQPSRSSTLGPQFVAAKSNPVPATPEAPEPLEALNPETGLAAQLASIDVHSLNSADLGASGQLFLMASQTLA